MSSRRIRRRRRALLPPGWRSHLECGDDFFDDGFGDDVDAMRAAWHKYGASMMDELTDMDERPWAFDEFGPPAG